jgi:hypothetical protein
VTGYPTIKYFEKGHAAKDAKAAKAYDGPRDAEGIVQWVNNKFGMHAVPLTALPCLFCLSNGHAARWVYWQCHWLPFARGSVVGWWLCFYNGASMFNAIGGRLDLLTCPRIAQWQPHANDARSVSVTVGRYGGNIANAGLIPNEIRVSGLWTNA